MKHIVLLLTACINPVGMMFTVLQDKQQRKMQYLNAVKYYLERTSFNIVLCENSGEAFNELKEISDNSRLEFFSFHGNDYDKSLGKGYGEYGIIQYALKHSRFIRFATVIVKITGRLIVDNIGEIIQLQNRLFLYPKYYIFVSVNGHDALDSRCFVANKEFFLRYFLAPTNPINDFMGYYFEHYLFDSVKKLPYRYIVSDFALPLGIEGVSGTSGIEYVYERIEYVEKLYLLKKFCRDKALWYKDKNKLLYMWFICLYVFLKIEKKIYRFIKE